MGKSKNNKWFDDHDSERNRLNTWEQRRVAKRIAWEQKNVSIDEPVESDNRHAKKDYN
jgi:hypothetical protein